MDEILSSGADAATIAIAVYLLRLEMRLDRRILKLEEWRKAVAAKLATMV